MWRAAQILRGSLSLLMERIRQALARSPFRARFRLDAAARVYIAQHGMETIRRHAADFVHLRLAPAVPPNDGKQTPMHGHPVFMAQHACACCCRSCLLKWHGFPMGRALTEAEQAYIVSFLMQWIESQLTTPCAPPAHSKNPRTEPVQGVFDFGESPKYEAVRGQHQNPSSSAAGAGAGAAGAAASGEG